MKSNHLNNNLMQSGASIDPPLHSVWLGIEDYSLRSSLHLKTGLKINQIEKAKHEMDKVFESILNNINQQD